MIRRKYYSLTTLDDKRYLSVLTVVTRMQTESLTTATFSIKRETRK